MAYIPPAVHARPNRPAFVRPSGAGRISEIRIVDMPRNGRLLIDGAEWMGGGHWDADEPNVWVVPNPPNGRVLRVEDQYGNARGREWEESINWSSLESGELDWDSLAPIADADVGTLRIFGAPHTMLLVNDIMQAGVDRGGVVTYPNLPTGTYSVTINAVDGFQWSPTVTITRGQTTQLPLVRPAVPIVAPDLWTGVGTPTGTGTSAGTITIRGLSGWVYGLGAVGATVNPRLPFPASGIVGPDLYPPGDYDMIVRAADGTFARRLVTIRAGENTDVDARPFLAAATGTLTLTGARAGWTAALARINPSPAPIGAITFDVGGAFTQAGLPAGSYALIVGRAAGDNQTRTVMITAGATTTENVGAYFAPATGQLTVTGVPGWVVALAAPGSTTPLTPPATIPASGGITVPAPVGSYDLAVNDGVRPIQVRRITVTTAGLTVDTRSFFDAADSTPAATTANITVTGVAGWMLTLTPAGTTAFVSRLPILGSGTVSFPAVPGAYSLKVEDGAGHTTSRDVTVPATGLTLDVGPWLASQIATTQGPTTADPSKGTILLRGAPGTSVVTIPAAGISYTVDATGRPVALNVTPGTYGLTVTPVGSARRVQSVVVVAGQTVEVVYGAMPTPSALEIEQVQPVEQMCGPVLNRAALPWAPATACPGNELTAPDGTRWRALAATGGVTLAQLRADGTPTPAGMGLVTKVMIVGVVAAAGYAGWMWYSHRKPSGKQENPSKCSCGG